MYKKLCADQWSRELLLRFLSSVFSVALPFHHKLGTIRNVLKTPPFSRSLVWCPGCWRQEILHMRKRYSALSVRRTRSLMRRRKSSGQPDSGRSAKCAKLQLYTKYVPYLAFAKECFVSTFYEVQFWVEQFRVHVIMNIAVSIP